MSEPLNEFRRLSGLSEDTQSDAATAEGKLRGQCVEWAVGVITKIDSFTKEVEGVVAQMKAAGDDEVAHDWKDRLGDLREARKQVRYFLKSFDD